MSNRSKRVFLAATVAFAVHAVLVAPAGAVIIEPAGNAFDTWIRQSKPGDVFQSDSMSVWKTDPGATERYGVLQFDLSSVGVPITSAYIQLWNRNDGSLVQLPATWVNSSVLPGDLATFTWTNYVSTVQPSETSFTSLGAGNFNGVNGPRAGQYGTLSAASAADLAALNGVRTGDGKITMIFKASSGRRDWGDIGADMHAAKLVINQAPAEYDDLTLRINRVTGAATIVNPAASTGFNFNGYSITSNAGSLAPANWTTLHDAGNPTWDELGGTVNNVAETNLNSSLTIAAGASISLGNVFTPFGNESVEFQYSRPGAVFAESADVQVVGGLELQVKRIVGAGGVTEGTKVLLVNPEATSIAINGYDISSTEGSLTPAHFHGFQDAGVAGWDEVNLTSGSVAELRLTGSTIIPAGAVRSLGDAFTPGATQDLAFEFSITALQRTFFGEVKYADILAGDANGDKVVNIFDINLISANWNSAGPAGDANFDGAVNIFDINYVSAHWANTLPGSGSATAVPEPASCVLLSLGALAMLARFPGRQIQKRNRTIG